MCFLSQLRSRYIDLHCTTARERYDLLMQRCPGIVELLDLQDIASFLNVHPNTISKIRRDIMFDGMVAEGVKNFFLRKTLLSTLNQVALDFPDE